MVGEHFGVVKRVFENEALVAFIDLLGTRESYSTGLTEQQAQKTVWVLLSWFDICFSKCFKPDEIKRSFDVSIFSDSIVVYERRSTSDVVERLVDFALRYQADLLLKGVPSRATIVKDSFFSFKVTDSDPSTILGSRYTTISLCGGRAIKLAHDSQEGLPIGVYVQEKIVNGLNAQQRAGAIPVKNDGNLFFIKQRYDVLNFLPDKTLRLLANNPNASTRAIRRSLKTSHPGREALMKFLPWMLVHLGRENEIIRSKKSAMGKAPGSRSASDPPMLP
jgi:hypothetical protein